MKTMHKFGSFLLLMVVFIVGIAGCDQQGGTRSIPVNEDSVRGHILNIQDAVKYTARFRNSLQDTSTKQLAAGKSATDFGWAESFNRDAIAVLLNQKDSSGNEAAGVRIYYGYDEGGRVRLILVPYDKNGNDIIHQLIVEKTTKIPGISEAKAYWGNGQTIENGQRCPTICSNGSSGLSGH